MITIFPAWSHLDRQAMTNLRDATATLAIPIEVCGEILPRYDWFNIARANIRRSDCVILILTANSAASKHCEEEIAYAESVGVMTLIWAPDLVPDAPEWASRARWLSEQSIDAVQAITAALAVLD